MKRILSILVLAALGCGAAGAQDAQRKLTPVTDDVYRFQNNFHVSLLVISGDGVIVTDPINADAAEWLVGQIPGLTDQPITHLVYSHSHGDHASGGMAFGEVPNVVMHANAPEDIDGVEATIRFRNRLSLTVGDKVLELTYLGPGHGNDLIAMVVRPDNVAFVVDAVAARRLPYRDFGGANVDDWIEQVRRVTALDFDILVGGHGPVGDHDDAVAGLEYLEKLRAEVARQIRAGRSDDEIVERVTMDEYRHWLSYDQWRALNVAGMARHLRESGVGAQ